MARVLVSFLGKGRGQAYAPVVYRFADGVSEQTRYFGLALARQQAVDVLRILGTPGSMWDEMLLDMADELGDEASARLAELETAVKANAVTQAQLDALQPLLQPAFPYRLQLRLTGYGFDEADQVAMLQAIAQGIGPDDRLSLDVTHGFRHLPMLALIAASYLEAVHGAGLEAIWYGAFDHRGADGSVPAVNLSGLLRLAEWTRAMGNYRKDGDYGVFAPLLDAEGMNGGFLAQAAFAERINHPGEARAKIDNFLRQGAGPHSEQARLFLPLLEQSAQWRRGDSRAKWEASLAWQYLGRGDYLRAVMFGLEAVISRYCFEHKLPDSRYETREEARQALRVDADPDWLTLNGLRNRFAHGVADEHPRVRELASSETQLHDFLRRVFRRLLPA